MYSNVDISSMYYSCFSNLFDRGIHFLSSIAVFKKHAAWIRSVDESHHEEEYTKLPHIDYFLCCLLTKSKMHDKESV